MSSYRKNKNIYNLNKYLINNEIIKKSIYLLEEDNINQNKLISLINNLADFIQYNHYYTSIRSFNTLIDEIVSIIEDFNNENINEVYVVYKLSKVLNAFKIDVERESKINIFFYGKDKYNILEESLKINSKTIEDITQYIASYKKMMTIKLIY